MDANRLFEVSYSWYEEYNPTLLLGPENITEEEFRELCSSLIPEAAKLAVKKENSWIGWQEISNSLIELLVSKGFVEITPKKFDCWGNSIIRKKYLDGSDGDVERLGETLDLIEKHNKKIEDGCDEQANRPDGQN